MTPDSPTRPAVDKQGIGASAPKKFANINPNNPMERRATKRISPNEKCPCGSGKKYKKCCAARII